MRRTKANVGEPTIRPAGDKVNTVAAGNSRRAGARLVGPFVRKRATSSNLPRQYHNANCQARNRNSFQISYSL